MTRLAIVLVLLLAVATSAAPATRPAKPAPGGDVLKQRIDDIDFAGLTARQAIDAIAAKAGTTVAVNFKGLDGPAGNVKLRGRLMDVTVRQAIQHVLLELDAADDVHVTVGRSELTIRGSGDANRIETRVYNIAAQLERIAAEQATQLPRNTPANEVRLAAVEQLHKMITQHVAPASWRDAGGTDGSLSLSGTRLTVTNRTSALRELEAYLKELDKPRK
jgi:hypothetical protein